MEDIKKLEQYFEDFAPMISNIKRRLKYKWFAVEPDDIDSLVNLVILKLWRKNKKPDFVLTKQNLTKIAERAVAKEVYRRSECGVKILRDPETGKRQKLVSILPMVSLEESLGDELTIGDLLIDPSPSIEDILIEKEDLAEKKKLVLEVITERTYNQLCFEYENKCVSQEHLNLIQKIKKEIKKNEQNLFDREL